VKDDVSRVYVEIERVQSELAEIEGRRAHLLTSLKVLRAAQDGIEDPWFEFLLRSTFRGWFVRQSPRRERSTITRDQLIAAHSFLLELELQSTEAAVGAVMNIYAVHRSTVFAARKRWQELRAEADRVPDRRREIELFEQLYQSN
jgi:hypothetical protein